MLQFQYMYLFEDINVRSLIIIIEQCRVTVDICTFTGSTNHHASTITAALGAVIGVLVVLQIITLIGCGVVARRRNTNGS